MGQGVLKGEVSSPGVTPDDPFFEPELVPNRFEVLDIQSNRVRVLASNGPAATTLLPSDHGHEVFNSRRQVVEVIPETWTAVIQHPP